MPSFKKRYDAKQNKKTISLLKQFSDKIKNGEVEVETCDWWEALPGKYNLKVVVKESENSTSNPKF
jgi:hypothetical protein